MRDGGGDWGKRARLIDRLLPAGQLTIYLMHLFTRRRACVIKWCDQGFWCCFLVSLQGGAVRALLAAERQRGPRGGRHPEATRRPQQILRGGKPKLFVLHRILPFMRVDPTATCVYESTASHYRVARKKAQHDCRSSSAPLPLNAELKVQGTVLNSCVIEACSAAGGL